MSKLGEMIDAVHALRAKRIEMQREVDEIKGNEERMKREIIALLKDAAVEGATGQAANARVTKKVVPTVKDWSALYQYIRDTDAWDMLDRRCNAAAFRARLDDGVQVPGVEAYEVEDLSITRS